MPVMPAMPVMLWSKAREKNAFIARQGTYDLLYLDVKPPGRHQSNGKTPLPTFLVSALLTRQKCHTRARVPGPKRGPGGASRLRESGAPPNTPTNSTPHLVMVIFADSGTVCD